MGEIALRQIRAIIAVCEEGSFTRAAARENATQSGISQHVAAAERTLGVKLFERSAAGVRPTPAGQRYYKRGLKPFAPVLLKDCGPLKIVLPGLTNVRRRNIEVYFQTHGVEVADMIEMDAMIGTLELVKRSDWVAILSGLICIGDIARTTE